MSGLSTDPQGLVQVTNPKPLPLSPPHMYSLTHMYTVTIGQNQPLLQEQIVWTSEVPLTEGQLQGKRDTFWETEPTYEGRKEIWDALRAAVEAAEQEDYDLAQAILSGANISLPTGEQDFTWGTYLLHSLGYTIMSFFCG